MPSYSLLWILCFLCGLQYYCRADAEEICFEKYGCFSNKKPFHGKHATLPEHPSVIQTKFFLFTRKNPCKAQLLNTSNVENITKSYFNSSQNTVIIVHGFSHHYRKPWVTRMTKELLKRESLNVVNVDWEKGASFLTMFYWKAVANSRLVGTQVAYFVEALKNLSGIFPESVHIVGHSLGAHIAGYAGKKLSRRGLTLGRITGLDPAKPSFEGTHVVTRLDKTDASFVDVIHTNAAPLVWGGMGYRERLGHVDFYPNGGEYQPGCDNIFAAIWRNGLLNAKTCHHMRAVEYFTISIGRKYPFFAFPCSDWEDFTEGTCFDCISTPDVALMGYDADKRTYSDEPMYLKIMPTFPFCAYAYIVTITFSNSRNKHNSLYVKLFGSRYVAKKTKLALSEGEGSKAGLITSSHDIGDISSVEMFYYGFSSFYIEDIQVNVPHTKATYTACFRKTVTNSFWAFWTFSEKRYKTRAFAGSHCSMEVF